MLFFILVQFCHLFGVFLKEGLNGLEGGDERCFYWLDGVEEGEIMGEDGEIVLDGFPKMLKLRIMVIMV